MGQWLVVGGSVVFVGGLVNDLSMVQVLVVDGRWIGGEPVGRSVVGGLSVVVWFCNTPERKERLKNALSEKYEDI